MKKLLIPFLLLFLLIASACGNGATTEENNTATEESKTGTITYQSENGPIEVPAKPERVVVLSAFNSGSVMALGVNIVGIDSWSKMNPRYADYLENAVEVSDDSLEKIIELEPDLIIAAITNKNIDKLSEIAPTVTYTYGKVDYLTQHLEVGKLLNKEAEAQAWIDDFKQRAQKAGEDIKAKIGADTTVSVIEKWDKEFYVFGDNWGRGTEILYQEMKLAMPEKVKEMALKDGYYALSLEVLPDFAGDYLIVSKNQDADNSFMETDTYKNIPAVKNNQVFVVNAKEFYFNDPITLDFQLDYFIESFLGNSANTDGGKPETVTYQSENGPVEVPANPKRIIALTNAPNVISLGGNIVGVDQWTNMNPLFQEKLKGVTEVTDESLEKIIELDPDLIIVGSWMKNIDKLSEIAPTVVYTWGKLDYLTQQIEIGKLINKEKEARDWVDDFQKRAEAAGEAIRAKIGEDATVSVIENDTKQLYVFGDNWARGTEILYQAMNLKMPEKVKEMALEPGYYALSLEVLPEFAGDYIVFSKNPDGDGSFLETDTWKNIPAVKNNRVIEINMKASTYSDPITLEYLLEIFKEEFLGN